MNAEPGQGFYIHYVGAELDSTLAEGWLLLATILLVTSALLCVLFTLFPLTTIAALLASVVGPFFIAGPLSEVGLSVRRSLTRFGDRSLG